jgi:BASS family bile acid:Na+ symporter
LNQETRFTIQEAMTLQEMILLAAKLSIVLSVFALGLRATLAEATLLFHHPRQLIWTFTGMNIVMPAVALALCAIFNPPPAVKIALVTLSVSPVPPLFQNQALKKGGREDQTVATMTTTALLAIAFIPLAVELLGKIEGVETHMSAAAVANLVMATMLLPLLAGIAVHKMAPSFAEKTSAPLARFASLLLILAVLPILIAAGKAMFSLIGNGTLVSMVAFVLIAVAVGEFLGGPRPATRRMTAIATAARHPGMAIAIAQTNFPNQKLAAPAVLLYVLVSAIVSGIYFKKRFPAAQTQGA